MVISPDVTSRIRYVCTFPIPTFSLLSRVKLRGGICLALVILPSGHSTMLPSKHFTKMQKHVGLASTKTNQTRWDSHDNTFSDYHPYIDLSNHTYHNSLFIVLECTPQPTIPTNQSYYSQHTSTHNHSKGVESKVIVVPWVCSCMGFVPEGSSMSSRGYKSYTP